MSGGLLAISMRINKIKDDCATPSSNFYRSPEFRAAEIARIDGAIQSIKNRYMPDESRRFPLEEEWQNFKNRLVLFIEMDKSVRSAGGDPEGKTIDLFLGEQERSNDVGQNIPAVKAVWDTFKAAKENPGLKEFIAVMLEPLRSKIESMIEQERANAPPPAPPAQQARTSEELAMAASQTTLELERSARSAEKRRLLFQNTPNIAKLVQLLALSIAKEEYGEGIKEAFLGSDPSVISSSSLLKFLLLEASRHSSIPHTLDQWELDISDENRDVINRAKDQIRGDFFWIVEEVFLGKSPLSKEAQQLSDQLNATVKDIRISREDEQIYGQFLRDILGASSAYQEAFSVVATQEIASKKIQVLMEVVAEFGSLDPQSFFAAIDRAIEELLEDETLMVEPERLIEAWLKGLSEELQQNPHIMTSFQACPYLLDQLKRSDDADPIFQEEDARFSILLVPELLSKDPPRALKLIEEILEYDIDQTSLTLPIELFQMLLNLQPMLALQIAEYVPLRDRFQCIIRLMYVEGRSVYPALDLGKLVDRTIDEARDFLEGLLFKYLGEPTPQNTQKLKTEIRRLLKYLTAEIGAVLPKEVKNLHPTGSPEAQIEYALLDHCIDPHESQEAAEISEGEYDAREKIRVLFFPELIRIGGKTKVLALADEEIDWIDDSENIDTHFYIKELARSLLKASGFKFPWLDSHTLGPLSEPENPESIPLDESFIDRYFTAMGSAKDLKWAFLELVHLSAAAHEISIRHNNPSYKAFSLKAANLALEKIKGAKNIRGISIRREIENVITACDLIDSWIRNLFFLEIQEAQKIKREFEEKLFHLRKDLLAELTETKDQVSCLIDLFRQSVFLGKEEEGLQFAKRALALHSVLHVDLRTSEMNPSSFIDLLYAAISNIEVISSREGEEAKRLESEMRTFTLDLIGSLGNIEVSSELFIQVANVLRPPSVEFFSQAATRALQSIRALKARDIIRQQVQQKVLIKVIRGFGDKAPDVIAEAKNLLGTLLQELYDRQHANYTDPIEKMNFLQSLVEGFELLENSDQVISLAREAFALIIPGNFSDREFPLSKLTEGLIVYIKHIHDKRGEDLALEPEAPELRLIEAALKGFLCIPRRDHRILSLIRVQSNLIGYGYRADSALYKEFSGRMLKLALQEIEAPEIIGNENERDQEEFIEGLIRITRPIDEALADQFSRKLLQIQVRRRREKDDSDNPPNKRSNT